MRSKNIISTIVLGFFAFIGGGSFSDGELVFWGITIFVFVIFVIIYSSIQRSKDKEEQAKKDKEKEEAERRNTNKYNQDLYNLSEKYGENTLVIDILGMGNTKNVDSAIIVYEQKSIIRIMGKMYNFKDIIGVSVSDNQKIVHGQMASSTKTSTGSMVGRAVVGDLVAGPVGSIIGGSTAKKNTTFVQDDDSIVHDYTIHINVNDISTPIIHINTWNDSELTNKIVGLINVILVRNK